MNKIEHFSESADICYGEEAYSMFFIVVNTIYSIFAYTRKKRDYKEKRKRERLKEREREREIPGRYTHISCLKSCQIIKCSSITFYLKQSVDNIGTPFRG